MFISVMKIVKKTEVKFTDLVVQFNQPKSAANTITKVVKKALLDSKIVKSYECSWSETTSLMNIP